MRGLVQVLSSTTIFRNVVNKLENVLRNVLSVTQKTPPKQILPPHAGSRLSYCGCVTATRHQGNMNETFSDGVIVFRRYTTPYT